MCCLLHEFFHTRFMSNAGACWWPSVILRSWAKSSKAGTALNDLVSECMACLTPASYPGGGSVTGTPWSVHALAWRCTLHSYPACFPLETFYLMTPLAVCDLCLSSVQPLLLDPPVFPFTMFAPWFLPHLVPLLRCSAYAACTQQDFFITKINKSHYFSLGFAYLRLYFQQSS